MIAQAGHSKPYKGPDSYQVEDAALFFGREQDAEQLAALILSSRITLLHAQSGAGKTSLINALVIPKLEEKGWIPVRVLPQNDPIASAWISVLGYVLPPVQAEYLAALRIRDELCTQDENPTLGELLSRYDELLIRDPRKRSLIAPVEAAKIRDAPQLIQCTTYTPYVCRLLRSTCGLDEIQEHFRAISTFSETPFSSDINVDSETRIGDLLGLCADAKFAYAYKRLIAALDAPNPRLRGLIDNLVAVYGKRRSLFSLVLIFDQFEELFTRFVDLGLLTHNQQTELPDWRLKYDFFSQLRELYLIDPAAMQEVHDALPLRYVISMRSEYIAQLDPIRAFAPEIDASSFRLELLNPDGAKQAIQAPAREYGFSYTEECYQAIARDLTKEARFIEPAHVQIVCDKLWTEQGRILSEKSMWSDLPAAPTNKQEIGVELYRDQLNGAAGIMRAFLGDFMDSLDEVERLQTQELLEPLITGSGTRNIVERDALIRIPFRSQPCLERLLSKLVARTIVRVETRLGGQFVEITHEFLIPPIREAMRMGLYADFDFTRCRVALRMLGRLQETYAAKEAYRSVTRSDFDILSKYRSHIEWNDWGAEVMLRAAVRLGVARDETRFWAERLSLQSSDKVSSIENHQTVRDVVIDSVDECLTSSDSTEQRNSLKALVAIRSNETVEILIRIGMDSTNRELRDAAIAELVEAGDSINEKIADTVRRYLSDAVQPKQIYAVLGRLRRAGSTIAMTLPKDKISLRVGLSLFSELYPKGNRKIWARTIKATMIGMGTGICVLSFLILGKVTNLV